MHPFLLWRKIKSGCVCNPIIIIIIIQSILINLMQPLAFNPPSTPLIYSNWNEMHALLSHFVIHWLMVLINPFSEIVLLLNTEPCLILTCLFDMILTCLFAFNLSLRHPFGLLRRYASVIFIVEINICSFKVSLHYF